MKISEVLEEASHHPKGQQVSRWKMCCCFGFLLTINTSQWQFLSKLDVEVNCGVAVVPYYGSQMCTLLCSVLYETIMSSDLVGSCCSSLQGSREQHHVYLDVLRTRLRGNEEKESLHHVRVNILVEGKWWSLERRQCEEGDLSPQSVSVETPGDVTWGRNSNFHTLFSVEL